MKPLDSFDFETNFEAKFFVLDVDVKGENEQRYTELVHGWEGMLDAVSRAMHRYRFDGNGDLAPVEQEMQEHLMKVDSWTWSTTTDASPTKAVIERGLVTLTVMRLFANDLERVLFAEMYPHGMRPGDAEAYEDLGSPLLSSHRPPRDFTQPRRVDKDFTQPRLNQTGASHVMIERAGSRRSDA